MLPPCPRTSALLLALVLAAVAPAAARAQVPAPAPAPTAADPAFCGVPGASAPSPASALPPGPARDLYCLELLPSRSAPGAAGVARLAPAASPFGVAVTASGRQVYRLTLDLRDLPPPAALGAYTTYVAWAAPPMLAPMLKLGEVRNGRVDAGRVDFNRFLILISAEPSAAVQTRTGPLVLRGMSPSMRMSDTHLLGLGGMAAERDGGDHGAHAHPDEERAWRMPPMDPRVSPMPMPGLEDAVPAAEPYLPGWTVDADTVPDARPREVVDLVDGDTLRLEAGFVRRTIQGRTFVMYAFNGQYPGPLLRVPQGAEVVVDFRNGTDWPTAVHWHGVRLDNAFDGVPHLTQEPVETGQSFLYRVRFPDAGIYWYHPHHREDVTQDLGLYGNILVGSPLPGYYGPAHREEVLMLDDLLLGEAGLIPYGRERATHAVMGRFGNLLLVNGEPEYSLGARRGEVVRFHLTNVSNVRTFNLSFGGAPIKVVATDVGRFQREEWVQSVAIAPAERYVVDVRFPEAGEYAMVNGVQAIDHTADRFFAVTDTLGVVRVAPEAATPDLAAVFAALRSPPEVAAEIAPYRAHFDRAPDHELVLDLQATGLPYALEQLMASEAAAYVHPVEWEGTMPMMDWLPTTAEARWILREPSTGRENEEIRWQFRVGDVVKLRIHNHRGSLHPMAHPIHIHGQRFLVLATNGEPSGNLAWKDTALVPVGTTVDLLLELSNPGLWMLHCHIAEHLEAGMKMVFEVH